MQRSGASNSPRTIFFRSYICYQELITSSGLIKMKYCALSNIFYHIKQFYWYRIDFWVFCCHGKQGHHHSACKCSDAVSLMTFNLVRFDSELKPCVRANTVLCPSVDLKFTQLELPYIFPYIECQKSSFAMAGVRCFLAVRNFWIYLEYFMLSKEIIAFARLAAHCILKGSIS